MKGIKSFFMKFYYSIKGRFILKPVIRKALEEGKANLPEEYFIYDNGEDGFTGDKRGWYSKHLGIDIAKLPLEERVQHAYNWSAKRNPVWNIRYHPTASLDLTKLKTTVKGTVHSHGWVKGFQWYRATTGDKYKSTFLLIPITSTKSIYLRFGWKVYPYYNKFDVPLPKYKERSIWTITLRIRGEK